MLNISSLQAYDFEFGNFYYDILSDEEKTVELVGYKENSIPSDITIPQFVVSESTGEEYEVVAIGDEAFYESKIESVIFPESIYSIGKRAFKNAYNLKSINLPNSVINVGEDAFANCKNAMSLSTGNSIQNIGSGAFIFSGLTGDLIFPETLESIGGSAFFGTNISEVSLPASLTNLEMEVFSFCSSLKAINVSPENPLYSSKDGVLYNKDMTTVILAPPGLKEITIAEGTLEIAIFAFFSCKVESIYLPSSLKKIGFYAFSSSSLRSIEIPQNVSCIESNAFNDCWALRSVVLPASITELGESSFIFVYSLQSFTTYSLIPPDADSAFTSQDMPHAKAPIEKCDLYVPEESIKAYSEVYPWKMFKNILPIGSAGIDNAISESEKLYTVYSSSGMLILKDAEKENLSNLSPGLYIINGKKTLIK